MRKIRRYFVGVYLELKRVRWPRPVDLALDFTQVIVFGAFFALILFGFDFVVLKMLEFVGAR
jgi:preprotein translocase SecE subunit